MFKKILAILAGSLLAAAAFSAELELRDDHPQTYTVVRGDTLWDISARFLKSPWLWPEIWQANSQIDNPHLIYPGDQINLFYTADGQPRLIRGAGRPDVVKLSPRIRDAGGQRAITAIPLNEIKAWLDQSRILTPLDIEKLPYVVAVEEGHLLAAPGQVVYVRGLNARPGDDVDIVRSTVVYREVATHYLRKNATRKFEKRDHIAVKQKTFAGLWNDWVDDWGRERPTEILGHEVQRVARARVIAEGDPGTLAVLAADTEVIKGDLIATVDASSYDATYVPHAPESVPPNMRVLAVADTELYAGPERVVALSRGARDGVENGQVYSVFQPRVTQRDRVKFADEDLRTVFSNRKAKVTLPEEYLGHIMIFRTFEKISYGLVMDAIRPIRVGDLSRAPQSN